MSSPFADTVIAVPGVRSVVLATFTKSGIIFSLARNHLPQMTQISQM